MTTVAKTRAGHDTAITVDESGNIISTPLPSEAQKITHAVGAGAGALHTGKCVLWGFTSNKEDNAGGVTVYDGTSTSGAVIGVFDAIGQFSMAFPGNGLYLRTGLYVDITGTADLTFISAGFADVQAEDDHAIGQIGEQGERGKKHK